MRLLAKAGFALAAMICTLAAPSAQAADEVRQVVTTKSFAFLPMYVSEQMGYFREEGVNMQTLMAASSQVAAAMIAAGNADYYLASPVAGARAAAQGAPVRNCGAIMTQNPTSIVVSAAVAKAHGLSPAAGLSAEERIRVLKGLRVAAHTPGSSPDLTLKYMLHDADIDPERGVFILPITGDAILAALERDRIDAFAYSSPVAELAVARYGAVNILSLPRKEFAPLAGQLSIAMVCNQNWIEHQPQAAAATLRAMWRGMKLLKEDPMRARKAARGAFPQVDEAIFNAAFETNRNAFPESPAISRQQMEEALDFHVKTGGTPIAVKIEDTYSNAAVEKAAMAMK